MKPEDLDQVALLMKRYGATKPSDEFADGLVEAALAQHRATATHRNFPTSLVAWSITAMVVLLQVAFLIDQNPFSKNPSLYISIGGFLMGFIILIAICQKQLSSKMGSM